MLNGSNDAFLINTLAGANGGTFYVHACCPQSMGAKRQPRSGGAVRYAVRGPLKLDSLGKWGRATAPSP